MRTTTTAAALVLTLCMGGCARDVGRKIERFHDPALADRLDDIHEAVFRELLNERELFFLSLGLAGPGDDQDPADGLMERFADHPRPVKKVSEADVTAGWVKDRETGERGVVLWIATTRRISDGEVEVEAGHFLDGTNHHGSRMLLREQDGRWVVVERQGLWIG